MTLFSLHIPLLLLGSVFLAFVLLAFGLFLGLCRGAQRGEAQLAAALVEWHKAHGRMPFGVEDE